MLLTKSYADKKRIIAIFWAGEFGHLIMNVIPRVNKIRQENPDAHILFSSFEGDHIYFRDSDGSYTIDEYISFPWWACDRGCHEVKSELTHEAQKALDYCRAECAHYDDFVMMNTPVMTLADYSAEFKGSPVIAYPFGACLGDEAKIADGKHFVVMSRAKNYAGSHFRSWDGPRWRMFLNLVLGYTGGVAYVCGVPAESVQFEWSDRIVDMTRVGQRSEATLNLLSNARFCIGDCSGSSNYAIQCGTPTFVSGPPEYEVGFTDTKNYFGAYVRYQSTAMEALSPMSRFREFEKFLDNYHRTLQRDIYER